MAAPKSFLLSDVVPNQGATPNLTTRQKGDLLLAKIDLTLGDELVLPGVRPPLELAGGDTGGCALCSGGLA